MSEILLPRAQTEPVIPPAQSLPLVSATAEAFVIPRTIWLMVGGITMTLLGACWDFAWHMSIGRDTFWTPTHVMVQLGGILVGIASGYAIATTTFGGGSPAREASVRFLGLYGPAGAFLAFWGSIAMVVSAPFDDWWHRAYGLDVTLVTPPHVMLSVGWFAAQIGAMIWMARVINRSAAASQSRLVWLFLIVGAICVMLLATLVAQRTQLRAMHTAGCYLVVALFLPSMILATGRGSARKWGCTIVGALYMGIGVAAEWLLPLIPAQPKLGPVYHNVTHLIPLPFPLLLIVPAFIADLLLQRLERRSSWIKAVCVGPAFVLGLLVVQWPFANFLKSPASRNWIFGTAYFAYSDPAGFLYDPYKLRAPEPLGVFVLTLAVALMIAIATTRLGLAWGDWMRRIRR
jgi:hypothetical protein